MAFGSGPAIGAHDALALSQRSQLRGHIGPTRAPLVSVAHQRLLLGGVLVVEQQNVRVVATEALAKVGVVPPLEDHERGLRRQARFGPPRAPHGAWGRA
eukprot:scaffold24638_cov69-Phaeocystis_antarctica.AAC.1